MALINCPECGNSISDSANNCPNCGYPVNPISVVKPKGEGCFMQTLNLGCLIIVLIFVFAFIIGGIAIFSNIKTAAKEKQKIEKISK